MSIFKEYKDQNNLTAYVFDRNENIDFNLFGNKRFSNYLIGTKKYGESEIIWDRFVDTKLYEQKNKNNLTSGWKLDFMEGYVESIDGDTYVNDKTLKWTYFESEDEKLHREKNYKSIKQKTNRGVDKVANVGREIYTLIGFAIFVYLFVQLLIL